MKFTLAWLKEHLETDADVATIAERLTAIGLEVDKVEDRGAELAPFVVGYVVKAEQHPNADRLRVCLVDTGGGGDPVQVVCGAPNARTGMKGVFAPPGSHIPGTGLDLKQGVIRGVESNGMLCSEREMGLSEEHDGIIELEDDAPVGAPYASYAGLDDPVFAIELTPNRGDCASVHGIARDLAAAGLGRLKPMIPDPVPGSYDCPVTVSFDFPAGEEAACPMFASRLVRGVRNGPSPHWLQDRLRAIGLRPISALVDITNYLTFDVGRPLHVFDAAKVTGNITVRFARAGERLMALNGKTYDLDPGMTVVADEAGPEGMGGVIGGEPSGCTEETTDVLIECALFDPVRTAATGRKLQVISDARYRFERGVDPEFVVPGIEIATRMVLDLCGGEPSHVAVTGSVPDWHRTYQLRLDRVAKLGGLDVPEGEQQRILTDLGFMLEPGPEGVLNVSPPPWRNDVIGEADLVEEILRIKGLDAIPPISMRLPGVFPPRAVAPLRRRGVAARRALAARGLNEAVTWSFMKKDVARAFGATEAELELINPISSELDMMRPSILPNLLEAAARNAARGMTDVGLFEVGPIYREPSEKGQDLMAAGVRTGAAEARHWAVSGRPVDAFDAKADAIAALDAVGAPTANLQVSTDAPAWYHPGRSGCLRLGPTVIATFGEVHPGVVEQFGLAGPVAAFEVTIDRVPLAKKRSSTARPSLDASSLQPVTRDFAFLVADDVPAEKVLKASRAAEKQLIADVTLFDVYTGKGVEDGFRSLAITVTLQPRERTLTDAEIEAVADKVVQSVVKQTGATLRA